MESHLPMLSNLRTKSKGKFLAGPIFFPSETMASL